MRITFVYTPFTLICENQPNIKAVSENYGIYPPLNLAQVAAVARNTGCDVSLIDANALGLTREDLVKAINRTKPDLLAFTITTYMFHENRKWIGYLKRKTHVKTLVGGYHMSLYPRETLFYDEFDYGLIGEAEATFGKFVKYFPKNLKRIPGLVYRQRGIKINKSSNTIENLENIPFPARDLLPNEKYYSFISRNKNFTGIITSRGCPYQCIFCEQKLTKLRRRSADNIFKEMSECYHNHGIREVDFFDSCFTIDRENVLNLCKLLIKSNMDLIWSCRSRVDTVDRIMLQEMRKAGCYRIYYGIETGDENILKRLGKGTNLDSVRKTVALTKAQNIETFGYFMIGNPGDTRATIRKTMLFAQRLNLDYAQFSKVSTLPGTELYEMWKEENGYDYWMRYMTNSNNRTLMGRVGCNLPENEIESLAREAYRKFYYRPKILGRQIFSIKTGHQLYRYIKAGIDMAMTVK